MHRIPPALENLGSISLCGSGFRLALPQSIEGGEWRFKRFLSYLRVNKGLAGRLNIADPGFRVSQKWESGQAFGVRGWGDSSGAITCQRSPGQGYLALLIRELGTATTPIRIFTG